MAEVNVRNNVNTELSPVSYIKTTKTYQALPNMNWNSNTFQRKIMENTISMFAFVLKLTEILTFIIATPKTEHKFWTPSALEVGDFEDLL